MSSRLIRDRRIVDDDFATVALGDGEDATSIVLPPGPVIVPLAVWSERREALLVRRAPIGVMLLPTDVPAILGDDLARLAVVVIHFPRFTDGRGYSIAYQLRKRLGYRGELRAAGAVKRDQLFYLSRSGFNAFLLEEGVDAQSALASLDDFTATYQAAADERPPRFRVAMPPCEAPRG